MRLGRCQGLSKSRPRAAGPRRMDCPLLAVTLPTPVALLAVFALMCSVSASAQQPRLAVEAVPGEPMRIVLVTNGAPRPVIGEVRYEAVFADGSPAFTAAEVRDAGYVDAGSVLQFAVTGPAAEQASVSVLLTETPRGVRMKWTVGYTGEPKGFFPWTTGFRWQYASTITAASTVPTIRWVAPTGAHDWEIPGDAPYPDFECQVRTVQLADLPRIAFVTDWYDPDWIYSGDAQRAAFLKAGLPKESPSETTFTFAILQAEQATAEDLAAIFQGYPLSVALGDRDDPSVYTPGNPTEMLLRVANVTSQPVAARFSWDVHDYYGSETAARAPTDLNLGPGEDLDRPFTLRYDRSGLLFVRVRVEAGEWQREHWKTMAFLDERHQPDVDPESPFGLAALIANPSLYPDQFPLERVASLAERIGVRWLRTCPFPVKPDVTPEEEQAARAKVGILRRHGILPHVQLGHEITAQPNWQDTLRATLARFGDVSDRFEFGNELNPHVDPAPQRDAARTYSEQSLQPFREMLLAANPNAKVMPHGLGGIEASYLDGWGECGAWGLIDVLSVHPGSFPRAPEWDHEGEFWSLIPQLRTLKQALARYGDKPFWVTEIYAPTPPGRYGLDLRTSAEYLIRTYMVCLEWGAQVVEWYQLQDGVWFAPIPKPGDVEHNFGLLYSDLSPKPAYLAYASMTSQLAGLDFLGRRDLGDPELYAYAFGKDGVAQVHVMWSYREKHELDGSWAEIANRGRRPAMPWENRWSRFERLRLPAKGTVSVVDLMGNALELNVDEGQANLTLSGSPIFVTGLADLPPLPPPS